MVAGLYDITIEQGARLRRTIYWRNEDGDLVDLTDATALAHFKTHHADDDTLIALTTENGGITLGGVLGTIVLAMTTAQTEAFDAEDFGVWDLKVIDSADEADRPLEGKYSISPQVSVAVAP
jgi:hypothetical protein